MAAGKPSKRDKDKRRHEEIELRLNASDESRRRVQGQVLVAGGSRGGRVCGNRVCGSVHTHTHAA